MRKDDAKKIETDYSNCYTKTCWKCALWPVRQANKDMTCNDIHSAAQEVLGESQSHRYGSRKYVEQLLEGELVMSKGSN